MEMKTKRIQIKGRKYIRFFDISNPKIKCRDIPSGQEIDYFDLGDGVNFIPALSIVSIGKKFVNADFVNAEAVRRGIQEYYFAGGKIDKLRIKINSPEVKK